MTEERSLATRRKELGLSQEQLAALLAVTQGTVSRNETAEEPERRYVLALDALSARQQAGENLVQVADAEIADRAKVRAA